MGEILKSCPFCGSEVITRIGYDEWDGFVALICQGQKNTFCISRWIEGNEKKVVEKWNKRIEFRKETT